MKFIHLPWIERFFLIEAFVCLGVARLAILRLPFRWIVPYLGQHMAESSQVSKPEQKYLLLCTSKAIKIMSRHTPWESACLAQAIAGKMMLRIQGIQSTLYLGVAKEGENNLSAHAWLRSGDFIVTGAHGKEQFTVVSTFAK